MSVARRQNAFGARQGWFALAVRLLAVWLALVAALPQAGFAADLHHHLGDTHPDDRQTVPAVAPDSAAVSQAADPGLATHLHCGCHSVAPLSEASPIVADSRARPRYGLASVPRSSIAPDRLPRPPRA